MTILVVALAALIIVIGSALIIRRSQHILSSIDGQLTSLDRRFFSVDRQLSSLNGQLAEIGNSLRAADHLRNQEAIAANQRAVEISRQIHEGMVALRVQLNAISEHVSLVLGRLPAEVSARLELPISDLSARIAALSDAIDIDIRTPLRSSPIDSALLEARTEEEVAALAEPLAVLRPLVPYPKWRFDADLANPDLSFHLRQRIWQYWNNRQVEAPLVVHWHCGTYLCLYLGNDLSRQLYVAGCIDPNEFVFLDRFLQPGMTFLDAGANEGIHTVFAAKRAGSRGTVWAFEPSRRELARLRHNLELNHLSARVFALALADYSGESELMIAGYEHAGQNTLGALSYAGVEAMSKERIEVARLDDVVQRNPLLRVDLIKVDVEGAELRLLRGAAETLRRYRPVILFEACDTSLRHQGGSIEELIDFLVAHKYMLYLFDPHTGLPAKAIAGAYSANMLAVPTETSLPDAVYRPWPESGVVLAG